jgi:hypothetical protein
MLKYFNTAGPCNEKKHYIIPVLDRNKDIMSLIYREQYFVIHAARQTGKTTFIKTLVNKINKDNNYYALYCSLEAVQVFVEPETGIKQILSVLKKSFRYSKIPNKEKFGINTEGETVSTLINVALSDFCMEIDKPLIIFFDEIDGLENGTLVTFLRQLRDGYVNRPETPFVHSIALVGMRDIRDYKSKIKEGRETLGSKSPFNIIEDSFTLENFTNKEIKNLYKQHTDETGQIHGEQAIDFIHKQTDGQPWLVNAIAKECIEKILKNNFTKPLSKDIAKQAIQNIILRRDTHIDSLLDKLKEKRVQDIIEPIVITTEKNDNINYSSDDLQYCKDLGLVKESKNKVLQPANPIYAEVIIRELSYNSQSKLQNQIKNIWIDKNNKIDMKGLLKAFQIFWRENSDIWIEKYQYKEAAPHLILQAFLQSIINSGGEILREYAYARKRIDLCVIFEQNKYPVELKIHYGQKTIPDGLEQLSEYMDGFGEKIGWLIIFDRRKTPTWDEKIYWKTQKYNNKIINIAGC